MASGVFRCGDLLLRDLDDVRLVLLDAEIVEGEPRSHVVLQDGRTLVTDRETALRVQAQIELAAEPPTLKPRFVLRLPITGGAFRVWMVADIDDEDVAGERVVTLVALDGSAEGEQYSVPLTLLQAAHPDLL